MEEALEEDRGHKAALASVTEEELCLWLLQERLAYMCFVTIAPGGRSVYIVHKNGIKSKWL